MARFRSTRQHVHAAIAAARDQLEEIERQLTMYKRIEANVSTAKSIAELGAVGLRLTRLARNEKLHYGVPKPFGDPMAKPESFEEVD